MREPHILIAGVGNIFFGDDAFGVEVARRLAGRPMPSNVRVVDFGIRGIDLAYALLDGFDAVILVDAVSRGGAPGSLYLIEPDLDGDNLPAATMEPHSLDPWRVLGLAQTLGSRYGSVFLVGCEPASCDPDEGSMELSAPVQAALPAAIAMIDAVIAKIRAEGLLEGEDMSMRRHALVGGAG